MNIKKFLEYSPKIHPKAKIHSTAIIIGNVEIEEDVSIWPYAVIRGDVDRIKISKKSNIQDNCVIHPNLNKPVIIGECVTVGHSAVIHGSIIGSYSLIGMNSTIIDCEVGNFCLVAGGCVLTPGTKIPSGSLVAGVPGKIIRALTDTEIENLKRSADEYFKLAQMYEEF